MKFVRLDDEFMWLAQRLRRVERVPDAARFVGTLHDRRRVWIVECGAACRR